MNRICLLLFFFSFFIAGCAMTSYKAPDQGSEITHDEWTTLLRKHVNAKGDVDYQGFIEDSTTLNGYLQKLSDNPVAEDSGDAYAIAYWINAYNAYTVKLIVDNYPLESIQDLHPSLKIPGVNTVWHEEFFQIGDQDMSLDYIEHEILRKEYKEPRIHFAINCASKSCPPLLNRAYTPGELGDQLQTQAKAFINNETYNKIGEDQVQISQIFKWFKKDFTENGTVTDYLNQYTSQSIKADARVDYMDYDWSLNEQ